MSGSLIASAPPATVCVRCIREITRREFQLSTPSLLQIRGKKKANRRTTIPVRLLRDVPEYGRKGALVPIPMGPMRNFYFPSRIADYIPPEELRRLKKADTRFERDLTFGVDAGRREEKGAPQPQTQARQIRLEQISPEAAFDLIDGALPAMLDFYRRPIGTPADRETPQPPRSSSEEAETAAPSPSTSPRQTPDNIFGSVSTNDIQIAIKTRLAQMGYVASISLPNQDIRFVNIAGSDEDATRLKKLGEYEVEITVKGHAGVMKRAVRVLPDDGVTRANQETPIGDVGFSYDLAKPSVMDRVAESA